MTTLASTVYSDNGRTSFLNHPTYQWVIYLAGNLISDAQSTWWAHGCSGVQSTLADAIQIAHQTFLFQPDIKNAPRWAKSYKAAGARIIVTFASPGTQKHNRYMFRFAKYLPDLLHRVGG
jgi:hypothetical protein